MKSHCTMSMSDKETMSLGELTAKSVFPGAIICLSGDLGSGKTTFVKGMARGLKIQPEAVNSPTFVLLNIYEGRRPLYHFDFYRLENTDEIAAIGYEEFLYGDGIAVIEWAERMNALIPAEYLGIQFTHKSEHERGIKFSGRGRRYEAVLEEIQATLLKK